MEAYGGLSNGVSGGMLEHAQTQKAAQHQSAGYLQQVHPAVTREDLIEMYTKLQDALMLVTRCLGRMR